MSAGTHPDLEIVSKPADKRDIPLAAFIGEDDRRMKEGLCHRIGLKPFMGGRKVAIIDDADFLNPEGANALLKTLEEPPPRSVLILIGTTADKQLPTIRSRSQIIRFRPLPEDSVARLWSSAVLSASRPRRGGSPPTAAAASHRRPNWLILNCGLLAAIYSAPWLVGRWKAFARRRR